MRTITVKGIGKVSAGVDLVELSFHIQEKQKDYSAALKGAAEKVDALGKALSEAGFAPEDFQTTGFRVTTEYESVRDARGDYQTVFTGYLCSYDQKLSLDFHPARLGEALEAMDRSGAGPELQVSFTVKHPETLEAELLKAAAANARSRAEILCAASGVRLGELQSVSYDFHSLPFRSQTTMDAAGAAPMLMAKRSMAESLRPQDMDLEDSAVFVWEIL